MDEQQPDAWAKALRAERKRLGMTQAEFCVLIGYSAHPQIVASIEAGRIARSPRTRMAIEAALGKRLLG